MISAAELREAAAVDAWVSLPAQQNGWTANRARLREAADTIELLERRVAWWRRIYVDDIVPDDASFLDQACEEATAKPGE